MKIIFQSEKYDDIQIVIEMSNIDNLTMERRQEFLNILDSSYNSLVSIGNFIINGGKHCG